MKPAAENTGTDLPEVKPSAQARQPMLMVVCGETGVGKTHRNVQEIAAYLKDDPLTGRKGRKVLVFDVNDDDYERYPSVAPDHIKKLKQVRARRIRPYNANGSLMSITEKRDTVSRMIRDFRDGLMVLEDLDKFMVGAKGQEIVSLLSTNRHSGLDIMICHQSIAKINPTEFQNCTWLRVHKQVDDIARYQDRIPNYSIVRIATLIVEEQYLIGNIRFFVYVDMRRLKIRGCSKESFIRACRKYIDTEEDRIIRRMMLETSFTGNLIYQNRNEVLVKLITDHMRYYECGNKSPF